jgi:hypothetical protein
LSKVRNLRVDPLLLFLEAGYGGGEDVTRECGGHLTNSVLCQMCDRVRKGGIGAGAMNFRTNVAPAESLT